MATLQELNERSREILRQIVDAYVETGEPVGSRTLSRRLGMSLSPASVRNVMADLTEMGLLHAPHSSAGRLPTDAGMRLFVDGLLEIGALSPDDREAIEARCAAAGRGMEDVLQEASTMLSGLSACAGLVVAPKVDRPLRHVDFVHLGPGRALVVLVTEDGLVENRVIEVPPDLGPSALTMAANYLNARLTGRSLGEAIEEIRTEIEQKRTQLDALAEQAVEAGLASWAGGNRDEDAGRLIIKGQAHLLQDVSALEDLERIRGLFEALEQRETLLRLIDATDRGDGVQIFIGAENTLFNHAGCSVIITPYMNSRDQVIGAIGVIGPTRLNYGRIIPMVDYTAKVVGRLIG